MKKAITAICCVLCLIIPTIFGGSINYVNAETELSMNCKSSLLMDFESGEVIFEQNSEENLQVASIVKLMTALITMEEIEKGTFALDTMLSTTENASGMGGSQVFIDPYEQYSVYDMLRSVIVASANDASVALAEFISGSEEVFVQRMNSRAKELGLNNTVYCNASGLPELNQYSTAKDVALLMQEVMKHKTYFDFSTVWMDKLTHPSGRETEVVNTNKLIRYFKGCDAGKTGSTDEAGYCLVSSAVRGNMRLIAVVLGAKTSTERFNESSKLLNYGFANFENKPIVCSSTALATLPVVKSKQQSVEVYAKDNYFAVCKKGELSTYETRFELPDKIKAPLEAGDSVGKLKITKDGVVVKEIDIVVNNAVQRISFKDGIKAIADKW